MLEGFSTIDAKSAAGILDSAGFDVGFEKICENGNIAILIILFYLWLLVIRENKRYEMIKSFR